MNLIAYDSSIDDAVTRPSKWLIRLSALVVIAVTWSAREMVPQVIAAEPTSDHAYAKSELLIEARELLQPATRPGARRILDVRPLEKYQEGHLKDAVHIEFADWAKDFGDGKNVEVWGQRLGQLGIGRDTEVIVYDDRASQDASRVWWYLRYWGACQVRVVNGGWKSIVAAGLPTETASKAPAITSYSAPPIASRRIELADLVAAHKAGKLGTNQSGAIQLIDTRTAKEFSGEQVAEGQRPGTIPGARHLEWADLVNAETGRFLPTAEIVAITKQRGIDLNQPIVAFSNTKGRSSAISFPLELAGATSVRIFDVGIKGWASDPENPVAIPGQR